MKELLERFLVLKAGEAGAVLASLATLLCTFSSYTMLRPVRDAFGVTSGLDKIPYLFWGVFLVMLLLQPVYGYLTSRFARSVFLPWVYAFFIANLLAFWVWFHLQSDHTWIARTYYVWVSVFNLFVVAAFWGLMADVFTREQAGRLFGFIWAGASAGGLIGPALDQLLAGAARRGQPAADLGGFAAGGPRVHDAGHPPPPRRRGGGRCRRRRAPTRRSAAACCPPSPRWGARLTSSASRCSCCS